jgi:Uma2 family endonuclease
VAAIPQTRRGDSEPFEVELAGPAVVIEEEDLRVPAASHTLGGFRQWVHSGRFPERGRIDFLAGDVEVDMSPEDLFTHSSPKTEIAALLHRLVVEPDLGSVFIDRGRVTSLVADLSAEPDAVVLLWSSLEDGRARLVPAATEKPGRFVEIEGAPDLVVEIVSDSSKGKDLRRLPPLYARAGIPELWLVDARGEDLSFTVHALAGGSYQPQRADPEGWIASPTLGTSLRFTREPGRFHSWRYRLEHRG